MQGERLAAEQELVKATPRRTSTPDEIRALLAGLGDTGHFVSNPLGS